MKPTPTGFASYVKNQARMSSSSKRRVKNELVGFYGSLYGTAETVGGIQSFFSSLFQGKMTLAKLAVYLIATLTLSTGVYASVAPESFAKTSASVKAGVVAVVDTTLEVVGIKAKNETNVEASVDIEAGAESNSKAEGKGLLNLIFGSDNEGDVDSKGSIESNTTIKSDTNVEANINANAKVGVEADAVIDEVDVVIDSALDTAGSIDAGVNALIGSDTSTTTKTNDTDTQTDTSIKGEVESTVNTQGTTNAVKEEKNAVVDTAKDIDPSVEVSSKTSSKTSVQGATNNDSIEGTINSATESENSLGLGL